jgi:membrane-bound lytic murein transglycosylase D
MKSKLALLSVLPVFLLFGCIQTVHKPTVAQDGTYISDRTNTSDLEKASTTMEPEDQIFSPEEKTDESFRSHASDLSESSEKVASQDPKSLPVESSIPENNTGNSKPGNETGTAVHAHQREKIQPVLDEALDFCQASQDFWQQGDLDNALEALDHAYSLILGIHEDNTPKLIQQKEDLRFMIAKRILEIYASRNIVVNGNHNAIPLIVNKHVQNEINRFAQGAEKKFFIASYKRSGKYRPQIVSALKAAGLPEELSWLPLIESGFKVNALSKARALGLWQFIPSTGYKFGLNRDKYIDERIDPVKSTLAAIAYLKELHQIFGDWSTVLAAYNCGEGQVLRVIRSQNINYLDNFWDLYERLPLETARYVPRFIATLYIINHA